MLHAITLGCLRRSMGQRSVSRWYDRQRIHRVGACLLAIGVVACKNHEPSPALVGSADPWHPPAGSALDLPDWATLPPLVLRERINGVNADVVMLKSEPEFAEYRDAMARAERIPGVIAAEPFIFVEGDVALGPAAPQPAKIKAVDPARVQRVLTVGKHLTAGTLPAHDDDLVLGDGLAKKLGAYLGDALTVHLPEADGHAASQRTFRLAGTFHMAFNDYDNGLAFITLSAGQALEGHGDQVMGIEMIVKDVEHADAVAKAYEDDLGGPPYRAMDWYELNKPMYSALLGDRRP